MKASHLFLTTAILVSAAASASTQSTERVNVASDGQQTQKGKHSYLCGVSQEGRFVCFSSEAANLDPTDGNSAIDIFVRDRVTSTTERVSLSSSGTEGNGHSHSASISADGQVVAFVSLASNLVLGDTNNVRDIFVRDRSTGITTRVSVRSNGAQANNWSVDPHISANGRYVLFSSYATNLVTDDTNTAQDCFVHDRFDQTTIRVSVNSQGVEGNDQSYANSISADGTFVSFHSYATNLIGHDHNGYHDIFVRDLLTGTTTLESVSTSGEQGNNWSEDSMLSADGRFVAFVSHATNLVKPDQNPSRDVFVRDRLLGTTIMASVASDGSQADDDYVLLTGVSSNGRRVCFTSRHDFVSDDHNSRPDVYLRDIDLGTTTRSSLSNTDKGGNSDSGNGMPSGDGRQVFFDSYADNLVSGDTNRAADVFVRRQVLQLEASAEDVNTGDTLLLDTWVGIPSDPVVMFLTNVDGTPLFFLLAIGAFDDGFDWNLTLVVPPGVAGHSFTLRSAVPDFGLVQLSNEVTIRVH